jgi:cytochrome c551/c552
MKRLILTGLALVLVTTLAGCGGSGTPSAGNDVAATATPPASAASAGAMPDQSPLDKGPRAAELGAPNAAAAEQGEKLFTSKGCSACHAFGRRLTCPDLAGVTHRRTAQWMQGQILHPEVMTKSDPISHALFAQFALQMPNQHLTEDEAKAVIEYFKTHDAEGAEAKEEKK